MRILVLNPNTTEAMTRRLVEVGRVVAAAGMKLVPLIAPRGVPHIATRAEARIGGDVALELLAEHHKAVDAAIIAAFGDPGLLSAPSSSTSRSSAWRTRPCWRPACWPGVSPSSRSRGHTGPGTIQKYLLRSRVRQYPVFDREEKGRSQPR